MRPLAFVAVLLLAACGDPVRDAPPSPPPANTASAGPADAPDPQRPIAPGSRPETTTATISIEGTDERVDLRLVTVEDVPLPFSTYVPAGWTDDVLGSGEGTGVRFAMGRPPREGVVTLFVPSEPNRDGLDELARVVAESNGGAEPLGEAEPWVRSGYRFADGDRVGSVRVGEHAGVPFYVLVQHPVEMGDGVGPRAALVLDRLRWGDDGTAL